MRADAQNLARKLGKEIQRRRRARHWSQAALAEKAELSVHYVGQLERGKRLAALTVLVDLAELLGCSVDELLGKREPPSDGWVQETAALLSFVPVESRDVVRGLLIGAATGTNRLARKKKTGQDTDMPEQSRTPSEGPKKNRAAVELGRLGGMKGGKARTAALSPAKRKALARKAARSRWK